MKLNYVNISFYNWAIGKKLQGRATTFSFSSIQIPKFVLKKWKRKSSDWRVVPHWVPDGNQHFYFISDTNVNTTVA